MLVGIHSFYTLPDGFFIRRTKFDINFLLSKRHEGRYVKIFRLNSIYLKYEFRQSVRLKLICNELVRLVDILNIPVTFVFSIGQLLKLKNIFLL
jgi:hypothetical protein